MLCTMVDSLGRCGSSRYIRWTESVFVFTIKSSSYADTLVYKRGELVCQRACPLLSLALPRQMYQAFSHIAQGTVTAIAPSAHCSALVLVRDIVEYSPHTANSRGGDRPAPVSPLAMSGNNLHLKRRRAVRRAMLRVLKPTSKPRSVAC